MAEDQRRRRRSRSEEDENEADDQGWLRLSIGGGITISRHDNEMNRDHPTSPKRLKSLDFPLMRRPTCTDASHDFIMISQFSSPATNRASCSEFRSSEKQDMIVNWTPPASNHSNYHSSDEFPLPAGDIEFRIIQPPCRPKTGLWFMLKASQQYLEKETFLPQISKCYLRIKDGVMTIGLVKRYLINKLKLENESEMELTCKGQKLQPSFTLQHVRDNIWNSNSRRDLLTLLPTSSTAPHVMVLHYSRIASN